ncbi:MAG: hypothetical protein ACW986_07875 [Promethearchaeota archaeon]
MNKIWKCDICGKVIEVLHPAAPETVLLT